MKKNNDFNVLFDNVKEASELANTHGQIDIRNATLKVMEESGELAAEVLKYIGHKVTTDSKKETLKKMKSEGVDTFLAVLDVLNIAGLSKEEIIKLSDKAVTKWKKKHIQPKIQKSQSLKR